MTWDEIIEQGRARALDFGADWPSATSVLYRRIQVRQQEIFSTANRINPDYFGQNTVGALDANGDVNMASLDVEGSVVDPTAAVTRVEIQNPGSHPTLVRGDEVAIIPHNDPDAGIAPRMTLRSFILHAYCGDMDGVSSVCIYYGFRPALKPMPMDGSETSDLPSVYDELLVLDVTKFLVKLTMELATERKVAALGVVQEEIDAMLTTFIAEVADYAGAQVSRFGSVVGGQRT